MDRMPVVFVRSVAVCGRIRRVAHGRMVEMVIEL